jgi:hypothetical protein
LNGGLKNRAEYERMSCPFMSEPKPNNPTPAQSDGIKAVPPSETAAPAPLTKEEQWALFEKELKESDWGHQPC